MSYRRTSNFSSNCPWIPKPAMMADRSIDGTRMLWRDLSGRFLKNAKKGIDEAHLWNSLRYDTNGGTFEDGCLSDAWGADWLSPKKL